MTLIIDNVEKQFGNHTAVDGISVSVEKGQMFGMLGANGAGKTTTFRMIIGLLEPSNGTVTWNGQKLSYKYTNLIGYLPEERGLYPKLTVRDQLIYLGKLKGMKKNVIIDEMRLWLERFKVTEYETKKVEELSKGNQQKIQFIAAVLHKPELLILDEPFSGLDPVNSDMLKAAVRHIQDQGTTIVFSSHQMNNVEEMCEDIIMLKRGKAVLQGNLTEIKRGYGIKTVSISADYDLSFLKEQNQVTQYTETKNGVKIQVENEDAAKEIFSILADKGFVRKFEVEEPSLHDIFIDKVGGDANE
ncbi:MULTISPECIES: ABC transporter ATP-binding protein [Bacillaceae]|uniref:Sodium ABC transporter ATP-binding protein n=2 Tax=Bacillaceae TaxID=186817 RepID=A0A9D5DVJ5_9BACI|nr:MULTISPECIES: ABC transporter ATP-binding protein [Bacillaceae]KQL58873.1 sodium ABC transporter ATP-binding protein [Alkalicoccobacillus plakortidis]MBG9785201.1 sodium ABC transporter ATP-binding protein [Shouchella lehensis]RQW18920.1 ABC transporter ATP-binding protein [Bacillus sp. C1-1]TES46640.1 ABC transporter ATP-binding protein [Shouchella lehensis]